MLTNVKVQQAIALEMAERSKRTGVNQDRVVLELAKIAFVKMTDIVDPDTGEIRCDARDDDLACIEGIKCNVLLRIPGTVLKEKSRLLPS